MHFIALFYKWCNEMEHRKILMRHLMHKVHGIALKDALEAMLSTFCR